MAQTDEKEKKFIGGLIPLDVYWKMKRTCASRQETMANALLHAVLLYLDFPYSTSKGETKNGSK